MGNGLPDLFDDAEFHEYCSYGTGTGSTSPENLFSMLENLDNVIFPFSPPFGVLVSPREMDSSISPKPASSGLRSRDATEEDDVESLVCRKKMKVSSGTTQAVPVAADGVQVDGQQRMSHITVERNRRKQMNEHLAVLRSLMPCFYVKRGDQASIIGGVVDYIKELQQLVQSLEAKKQRKAYTDVLSPRLASSPRLPPLSPRPSPLSPRLPSLSPRMSLPVSPRTPQPGSPYRPISFPTITAASSSHESSPISGLESSELVANSKSPVADVEVKFSGSNVLLKTVSHHIPGQALKIITILEGLPLEILHVSISTVDDTMHNSFTIKIGLECELSAEELAQEVQQTFASGC